MAKLVTFHLNDILTKIPTPYKLNLIVHKNICNSKKSNLYINSLQIVQKTRFIQQKLISEIVTHSVSINILNKNFQKIQESLTNVQTKSIKSEWFAFFRANLN